VTVVAVKLLLVTVPPLNETVVAVISAPPLTWPLPKVIEETLCVVEPSASEPPPTVIPVLEFPKAPLVDTVTVPAFTARLPKVLAALLNVTEEFA
jgi:hypothetical protein